VLKLEEWDMDTALAVRYEEGYDAGRDEGRDASVRRLSAKGISDEVIASYFDLPLEEVQRILAE